MNDEEKTYFTAVEMKYGNAACVPLILYAYCVCVLHLKPLFLPVDIQHNQSFI